ncbi:MAG: T9SS type A sorting domain-containing protein [Chryseobacterium jejuense]|uniref:T9SS type A sorting domain-containing protein n=1 Tax=Chryseobacterium jejuense TaxID=445960 RepID=UPI003D0E0497
MRKKLSEFSILRSRLVTSKSRLGLGLQLIHTEKQLNLKKMYRSLVIAGLLPVCMSAQYSQSFDANTMPADWTRINKPFEGWKPRTSIGSINPHSGSRLLGLEETMTGFAHDDYAISPAILVTSGVSDKLRFWAVNMLDNGQDKKFDIKISVTSPTKDAFTQTLVAGLEPLSSWQQYTYDLTPYIGQTIYIAFYSSYQDGGIVGIDDFEISGSSLSVSEVKRKGASLYPNPANKILNIENDTKIVNIDIYDLSGKLKRKEEINSGNAKIDISDLTAGSYILKIKEEQGERSYKIIKK